MTQKHYTPITISGKGYIVDPDQRINEGDWFVWKTLNTNHVRQCSPSINIGGGIGDTVCFKGNNYLSRGETFKIIATINHTLPGIHQIRTVEEDVEALADKELESKNWDISSDRQIWWKHGFKNGYRKANPNKYSIEDMKDIFVRGCYNRDHGLTRGEVDEDVFKKELESLTPTIAKVTLWFEEYHLMEKAGGHIKKIVNAQAYTENDEKIKVTVINN